MRTLFSTLPWVEAAVALLPQATPTYAPLRELFQACDKQRDDGGSGTQVLHGCPRSTFVPDLIVRPARVEDHDDLVPVFNKQSAALTAIYGDFFLAELIQSQNEANKAIVGEVRNFLMSNCICTRVRLRTTLSKPHFTVIFPLTRRVFGLPVW